MPCLQPGTPAPPATGSGLQNHQMIDSAVWSRILFYSSPFTSDELRSEWTEYIEGQPAPWQGERDKRAELPAPSTS